MQEMCQQRDEKAKCFFTFGVTGRMYAHRFPFLFRKSGDLPADPAVHWSSGGPGVQPSLSVSGSCSGFKNGKVG